MNARKAIAEAVSALRAGTPKSAASQRQMSAALNLEQQVWAADVARGLSAYHAKHGPASDAVAMPRAVLGMLAKIKPVDEHAENGPGRVVCPACGSWMSMRWSGWARLDDPADMTHDVHCPAVWARRLV